MECLKDSKLQEYLEGGLGPIESGMVRDHLLTCTACQKRQKSYQRLHKRLQTPEMKEPPLSIIQRVMAIVYPKLPVWPAVLGLSAAAFLFAVTSIYIYFDFANNSLWQAMQMASSSTSNWLSGAVRFISASVSMAYAAFRAVSAFLRLFLHIEVGTGLIAASTLGLTLILGYLMIRLLNRHLRTLKR